MMMMTAIIVTMMMTMYTNNDNDGDDNKTDSKDVDGSTNIYDDKDCHGSQVNVNVNVFKKKCEIPLDHFNLVNMDLTDLKYVTWIMATKHYMPGWIATGICCFARTITAGRCYVHRYVASWQTQIQFYPKFKMHVTCDLKSSTQTLHVEAEVIAKTQLAPILLHRLLGKYFSL